MEDRRFRLRERAAAAVPGRRRKTEIPGDWENGYICNPEPGKYIPVRILGPWKQEEVQKEKQNGESWVVGIRRLLMECGNTGTSGTHIHKGFEQYRNILMEGGE